MGKTLKGWKYLIQQLYRCRVLKGKMNNIYTFFLITQTTTEGSYTIRKTGQSSTPTLS